MLRALRPEDSVKLVGSTPLGVIAQSIDVIAARLGLKLFRDDHFAPGLGSFDLFEGETDGGVVFCIAAAHTQRTQTALFAHAVADLPAIARALELPLHALDGETVDADKPWQVVRLDDNGNRVVLNRCATARDADRAAEMWTARIGFHHQSIVVERDPSTVS